MPSEFKEFDYNDIFTVTDEDGIKYIGLSDSVENPVSFGRRFRFDSDSNSGSIRTAIPKNIRTLMGCQSE